MKRIVVIIVLVAFGFVLNAQPLINVPNPKNQNLGTSFYQPQMLIVDRAESMSMGYIFYKDTINYAYKTNGIIVSEETIHQFIHTKHLYNYDNNNNLISDSLYTLINNIWTYGNIVTSYYYDTNNILIYKIQDSVIKTSYIYDNNGNLINEIRFDLDNNQWNYVHRYTYTYDNLGNKIIELFEQWFCPNNNNCYWYLKSKDSCIYDSNNKLINKFQSYWQNSTWIINDRLSVTYNSNNNKITDLTEVYQNNVWVNYKKNIYNYDTNNNLTSFINQYWSINSWYNLFKDSCTYDANGNCILSEFYEWTNNNWAIRILSEIYLLLNYNNMSNCLDIYASKITATYISFVGIENPTIINNNISIYPNPTKEWLNITNAEKGDIHIYNVLGEEVMNAKCNEGNNTINVSKLSIGTYIVKIVSVKNVITKNLIIW